MDQEILKSFLLWFAVCSSYAFLRLELKVRIRTAIETTTADMLQTVWNELDYRFDVCRICKVCNKNVECFSINLLAPEFYI